MEYSWQAKSGVVGWGPGLRCAVGGGGPCISIPDMGKLQPGVYKRLKEIIVVSNKIAIFHKFVQCFKSPFNKKLNTVGLQRLFRCIASDYFHLKCKHTLHTHHIISRSP